MYTLFFFKSKWVSKMGMHTSAFVCFIHELHTVLRVWPLVFYGYCGSRLFCFVYNPALFTPNV